MTDPSAQRKHSHMDTYEVNFPKIFGALSDPTRLAVVDKLLDGPASVTDLSRPFDMAGPSFLKHLRVLEDAGIVVSNKSGRVRTVSLVPDSLMRVEHWVRQHRARLEDRFDRLGNFLNQEQ
ncbi:ArsR/SmtB family transcription factor [Rhizobium acaciae]|uniref:ArsR/SmtB family transcription factor n=1 Tax=Rhizobium acaciae TaxID=2989736 RepID=UPI0029CA6036|nr:metalloregulator ArsR/SmtB family transcription factor [Rhizobium acaciae]